MEVNEIRERKSALESHILRLINMFEAETMTKVKDLDYYSSPKQGVYNGLKITVEI